MANEVKPEVDPITEEQSKLAKDLLKLISTSEIRVGNREQALEPVKYKELALAMIDLLYKKNIPEMEIELVFQLMRQAISIAQNAVGGSIEASKNIALTNMWGKHPEEVTLQDIDAKMAKQK